MDLDHLPPWVKFHRDSIHVDARLYAEARGIAVADAIAELQKLFGELLPPKTRIVVKE